MSVQKSMTLLMCCENEMECPKWDTGVYPKWCQMYLMLGNRLLDHKLTVALGGGGLGCIFHSESKKTKKPLSLQMKSAGLGNQTMFPASDSVLEKKIPSSVTLACL